MDSFQIFNRKIKNDIIAKYFQNASVVDLGSGDFGPIHQFDKADLVSIVCVEPDLAHTQEAKKRLSEKSFDFLRKVKFVEPACGYEHTELIVKYFHAQGLRKGNLTTAFFSLSFAFADSVVFDAMIKTVDMCTSKKSGMFIGTMMDGDATRSFLGEAGRRDHNAFSLGRLTERTGPFGNSLEINLAGTIVKKQIEYLADFETLKGGLEKINFLLHETGMFQPSEYDISDPDLRALCKTNRYFIFTRTASQ